MSSVTTASTSVTVLQQYPLEPFHSLLSRCLRTMQALTVAAHLAVHRAVWANPAQTMLIAAQIQSAARTAFAHVSAPQQNLAP